jgi:hypothetical protein
MISSNAVRVSLDKSARGFAGPLGSAFLFLQVM